MPKQPARLDRSATRFCRDGTRWERSLWPDYKTGVISNAWEGLKVLLDGWEILDAFDVVIGSGDVGVMKPDPRIYRLALGELGVQAAEAVFVDDFIENIHGARQVGIKGVHFLDPKQAVEEIKVFLDSW